MVKLFLDVNVVQDHLTLRQGAKASSAIIEMIRKRRFPGVIASFSVPTLWYLNRKASGVRNEIAVITKDLSFAPLTQKMIKQVLSKPNFPDLEDELQYLSAKNAKCTHLITRNAEDFPVRDLKVMTPERFLGNLR